MKHENLNEDELCLMRDELIINLSSDHVKKIKSMSRSLKCQSRLKKEISQRLFEKSVKARNTIIKLEKMDKEQSGKLRQWIKDLVEIDNRLKLAED